MSSRQKTGRDRARVIASLRKRIDLINRELLALIEDRAGVATKIALEKMHDGVPVMDKDRERAMIKEILRRSKKRIDDADLERIFSAVITASRRCAARAVRKKKRIS
jgi:chorismate mutase